MSTYITLIILSGLVICSYMFELLASKTRLPSVLLLLFLGIGLQQAFTYFHIQTFNFQAILPALGTIGLILIVFEGSLELRYESHKNKLISRSFLSALIILLATTTAIAIIIQHFSGYNFYVCFTNAIPLSIISSAIAIPSASGLDKQKKEFIVYESSFSDILGIIAFNFAINNRNITFSSFTRLGAEIVLILVISVISCLLLLYLMGRIGHHIKFFLIISILILVYALGQKYHLSALIIILAFGLFLNNADKIRIPLFRKVFLYSHLPKDLVQLLQLSAESAFIIRTFFFVIFGFTMSVSDLGQIELLMQGVIILFAVYMIRFIYLKFVARGDVFPEVFISPRGLISILLYYNLPAYLQIEEVGKGLLFVIILLSSIIMSIGLLLTRKRASV